jgi:hypothetical protein
MTLDDDRAALPNAAVLAGLGSGRPAVAPPDPTPRRERLRRLVRGRWLPAVAAGIVGALLATAGTLWWTGTGPFASTDRCWGVSVAADIRALDGRAESVVDEVPDTGSDGEPSRGVARGACRVLGHPTFTARIHQLDLTYDGLGRWGEEFLGSRLTPLGGGLLGMASDSRAWLSLPDDCPARPDDLRAPTVVDITYGPADPGVDTDVRARATLTHLLVRLTNGVLRQQGCAGTIGDPAATMPAPARYVRERPGQVCGVEGITLPYARYLSERRTPGREPVLSCEVGRGRADLRMLTVTDPRLGALFLRPAGDGDLRTAGPGVDGSGVVTERRGVFVAHCQAGAVAFVVSEQSRSDPGTVRELLVRYVAAQAPRAGCGDLAVRS